MSDPLVLISSEAITPEALREFVGTMGGEPADDAALPEHLARDGGHLWVGVSTGELASTIADGGPDYASRLTTLLGGPARSAVTIEMNRAPAAERLALDFALAFAERWAAVADDWGDDPDTRLLTVAALRSRRDVLAAATA